MKARTIVNSKKAFKNLNSRISLFNSFTIVFLRKRNIIVLNNLRYI